MHGMQREKTYDIYTYFFSTSVRDARMSHVLTIFDGGLLWSDVVVVHARASSIIASFDI